MKRFDAMSFREKEQLCEMAFSGCGPLWHLYTDGNAQSILFIDAAELKVGMNLFGVCVVSTPGVKIYTFELMNNHLHSVVEGEETAVRQFFESYKLKLQRYFAKSDRVVDLRGFECSLFRIENLQSLRNEIVYANRNGFLVRSDCTPYSYPWGANMCFYNLALKYLPSVPYKDLSVREKRKICHSNDVNIPDDGLMVFEGVLLPSSYCLISEAEKFFRDAHHYFHLLTRNFEAYSEIAKRMHDSLFLTDDELYAAISVISRKRYNVAQPSLLPGRDKIELAKCMHNDYNASNRQIRSILKIQAELVDELFPRK